MTTRPPESLPNDVTLELDSGLVTLKFGYSPLGRPNYSDVPTAIGNFATEQEATLAGARMVAIGSWHSFIVEKRYGPVATSGEVGP